MHDLGIRSRQAVGRALLGACAMAAASGAATAQEQRLAVEACLPEHRAIATDMVVDTTGMPAWMSQEDLRVLETRVREQGRLPWAEVSPRTLTRVRATKPEPGPAAAPETLTIGAVSVSQGLGSRSSMPSRLDDLTEQGQPVYGTVVPRQPAEVLAVQVLRRVSADGREVLTAYWFAVPRSVPTGMPTGWLAPQYQAPLSQQPSPGAELLQGGTLPSSPVDADAPRVRYQSVPQTGARSTPARLAAQARTLGAAAGVDPVVSGPTTATGTIPRC